jgi:hypothetical protein
MNQLALNRKSKDQDPSCGDVMTMAERELAAFFRAVTELFGSEEAEVSAKDWLRELTAMHDLPTSIRQLRSLTIKAAARLAGRVNASSIILAS